MKDQFIASQWKELCDHLERVAQHLRARNDDAAKFREQSSPESYPDLLDRVRKATHLAGRWRREVVDHEHDEQLIDEAGEESFPASDPPTFSHSHA